MAGLVVPVAVGVVAGAGGPCPGMDVPVTAGVGEGQRPAQGKAGAGSAGPARWPPVTAARAGPSRHREEKRW
jgi:hypothetical protein